MHTKKSLRSVVFGGSTLAAFSFYCRVKKKGGDLLSRIALQYHRRGRA